MKVGIVGCGYVFDKYMATWGRHPDLTIAGVTDIARDRIEAVTAHYGLRGYDNTAALLADPAIDIVANFTPIKAPSRPTTTSPRRRWKPANMSIPKNRWSLA